MHRVLEHRERRLDEQLELDALARVANFSAFHFHRLFTAWMDKVAPWMETNGLFGKPRYGISYDDPGITEARKLRYDAAVEVPKDFKGAGDHHMTVIPGGKYAAGRFKGTDKEVGEAWNWLLR